MLQLHGTLARAGFSGCFVVGGRWDMQALSMAHCIGQVQQPVPVYRLVTKGTLEERVHHLVEKKKGCELVFKSSIRLDCWLFFCSTCCNLHNACCVPPAQFPLTISPHVKYMLLLRARQHKYCSPLCESRQAQGYFSRRLFWARLCPLYSLACECAPVRKDQSMQGLGPQGIPSSVQLPSLL